MTGRLVLPAAVSVLALVLFSGLATAQAVATTGQISATEVSIPKGGKVDSGLLAVYLFDPVIPDSSNGQAISFNLNASQVRVETYQADPVLVTSASFHVPPMNGYEPDTRQYVDARLESQAARPGYQLNVVAADAGAQIHMASECGAMVSSTWQDFEAQPLVAPPANPVRVDVSNSAQWSQCGQASVTVTGRFVMVVYGIDATLTTTNETVYLQSGDDQSSVSPLPPSGPAYATHRRQQYLYVDDGTLTFPMNRPSDLAFLSSPKVEAGDIEFRQADGELRGSGEVQSIHAGSLAVTGNLRLTASSSGGKIQSSLSGRLDSAAADGQPIPLSAAVAQPGSSAWPWILGAIGAVLVPTALLVPRVVRVRRQHVEDLLRRGKRAFELQEFTVAQRLAASAVALQPDNGMAHYRLAQALEQLDKHDEAEAHRIDAARLLQGAYGADNAYQAAEAAAIRHQDSAARRWLRDALSQDEALAREADANPVLRPVLLRLESERAVGMLRP